MSVIRHRSAWWLWLGLGVFVVLVGADVVLVAVNGESIVGQLSLFAAFFAFGVVGMIIVGRHPGNRIGLLLLWASGTSVLSGVGGGLATYLWGRGWRGASFAGALLGSNVLWLLGPILVLILLPLLFPDGRPPSPRWRALLGAVSVTFLLMVAGSVFGTEGFVATTEDETVANPFFVPALAPLEALANIFGLLLVVLLALSFASLVVRFRRSIDVERQQIKWLAFAVVLFVVAIGASELLALLGIDPDREFLGNVAFGVFFLAIPLGIGVAILKYRLYALDVVVRKALVVGALGVFIAGVYAAIVAGGSALLGRDDPTLSVFAAVVLAVAFQPARLRARKLADRLVYGRRAEPYEVLAEFSERMGESYATEDVLPRMAQILGRGTGAEHARVWILVGRELRGGALWPPDAPEAPAIPVRGDVLPDIPGETAIEVRDGGDLLGALSVVMPASEPMNPSKERLVHDLASQAGLVLRNVRLVEDLRESRRRLVAAQDEERRRLERNIHDGAQQQLVALTVKLRLAQGLVGKDAEKAETMLASLQAETQEALEDLRDLARGIYPPLLADKGLAAALEAQARKSPVPVSVEAGSIARFPQEIEAAVYFVCLEALQNVAKYANATGARVRLSRSNSKLEFAVVDDGCGFDPSSTGYGTGLQGIADRLHALDGDVRVDSVPGRGTTVSGTIPLAEGGDPT